MTKSRAKKSEPKFKLTARHITYVLPNGTEYGIPKGLRCVRVPGECKQDGSMIKNPWALHDTPAHLEEDSDFLRYARTYGIIIKEEFLTDKLPGRKEWFAQFKARATSEVLPGKNVTPEVVLAWASSCVSSDYWEQYSPDRLLQIFNEVYQGEFDNAHEFAWDYLENCDEKAYTALEENNLLAYFDIAGYWSRCLRYDYHEVKHEDPSTKVIRCFYVRANW